MNATIKRLALTPGEPAGIGPDLVLKIAQQGWPHEMVYITDRVLLEQRARLLDLPIKLITYDPDQPPRPSHPGEMLIAQHDLAAPVSPGILNDENGHFVLDTLRFACQGNMTGEFDAVITGPVHKGIINDAGISFSGHTEFFAQESSTIDVVMMLATDGLKVALVTTHIPLAYVAKAITPERLTKVIDILHQDLQVKYGLEQPKILICGLNPHAGEDGHLGKEEIQIISPTMELLRKSRGYDLRGPYPADTVFQEKYLQEADVILAMYHDQGLPVLKYKGFGHSVNITLGLPFIRTSVDHGTALGLAGTGKADPGSLTTAINHAIEMVEKRS